MNPWLERGSAVAYEAITQSCHCEAYSRFVRSTTDSKLRYIETGNTVSIDTRIRQTDSVIVTKIRDNFSSSVARKNETGKTYTRSTHITSWEWMDCAQEAEKQKCTLFRPVSYDSPLVLIIRDAEYGTGDGVLLAVRSEQRSINRRVYFSL